MTVEIRIPAIEVLVVVVVTLLSIITIGEEGDVVLSTATVITQHLIRFGDRLVHFVRNWITSRVVGVVESSQFVEGGSNGFDRVRGADVENLVVALTSIAVGSSHRSGIKRL